MSEEQARSIEEETRTQGETLMWREERRRRVTALRVGGIAKMRNSTKRAKRVEQVLYTNFSGSVAGMAMEGEALTQYVSYKKNNMVIQI